LDEREKVVDVSVVPDQDSPVALEPGEEPLDFPSVLVPSQRAAILCWWFDPTITVWCNQFDVDSGEDPLEGVAVVGSVADQANGSRSERPFFESIVN
jgi:hypothetical protein